MLHSLEAWLTSIDTWLTALDIVICLVDLALIGVFLALRLKDRERERKAAFTSRFRRRKPRDAPTPALGRRVLRAAARRR